MRIALDLDDTSGDATVEIIKYFNNRFNRNHSIESIVQMQESGLYNYKEDILVQLYDVTHEEVRGIFYEETGNIVHSIEPFQKALTFARVAYDMGCDLFYITARPNKCEQISWNWLMGSRFPKGELFCTEEKADLAKKLGIHKFYEDNVYNITQLMKAGIPCVMVDALCNHNITLPGVERVFWNEKINAARQLARLAV